MIDDEAAAELAAEMAERVAQRVAAARVRREQQAAELGNALLTAFDRGQAGTEPGNPMPMNGRGADARA